MDYYEILGVPRDADLKTIKKAYFKLVRQHSPEKDPEGFQRIREAYESLTADKGGEGQAGLMLEFPADSVAGWMRDEMQKLIRLKDYKTAMKIAEQGLDRYGEMEGFLYFLAVCQMRAGNTGKAAKNFELLTKRFPDKNVYKKLLAIAYYERGYGKKAYEAFGKAYEEGCRDHDFLDMYAMCARDRGQEQRCVAILKELCKVLEKSSKDNVFELVDSFGGILFMEAQGHAPEFLEDVERFGAFLEKNRVYVREYEEEVWQILVNLVYECRGGDGLSAVTKLAQQAKAVMYPESGGQADRIRDKWAYLEQEMEYWRMEGDERLWEVMSDAFEAFVTGHEDGAIARFMVRDVQLCILEEWPGLKGQFGIVEKEYPVFWEHLKDFADTLEKASDLERLRQQYQKDYDRREKSISGGQYYIRYPHRRPGMQTVQWSGEEGTYTRSQPKIGRNAPCPCGSGKKYKNCCGRNQ